MRIGENKVVLIVFDGLRPDFIDAARMPNLAKFARRSRWFREARSVFPSMTRVATTSIATGAMPAKHGLVGNAFYFPQVTADRILDLGSLSDIALAERATGGRLIEIPTFADCVAMAGATMAVVSTGAPGTTYCLNPRASRNRQWTFTLGGRSCSPTPQAVDDVEQRFGPPPPKAIPRACEMDYATDVFVEYVLPHISADLSVIWFNEPDTTFHYKGLSGSDTTALLQRLDFNFAQILNWIERQPDADRYGVIVASDHGHIATRDRVDLFNLLSAEGFLARRWAGNDLQGCTLALTAWNSGAATLLSQDKADLARLVRALQERKEIGLIFTRGRNDVEGWIAGTFSFGLAGIDHARAPDMLFTLASTEAFGAANIAGSGHIEYGCDVLPPGGMHGGLNRHELNSTLIAGGALFEGVTGGEPAGIIDIAPTVLGILAVPAAPTMQGRPLFSNSALPDVATLKEYTVSVKGYRQTLRRTEGDRLPGYLHSGSRG